MYQSKSKELPKPRGGFEFKTVSGLGLYTIPSFSDITGLTHCFTSRTGGISPKPYDSLNLSKLRPDAHSNVQKNIQHVCNAIKIKYDDIVLVNYEHGDNIHIADRIDAGSGIWAYSTLPGCDALITQKRRLPLMTLHADCLPVFFVEKKHHIIALAHAGWKGIITRICQKVVQTMTEQLWADPAEILVGIGPSIGPCHFETDEALAGRFVQEFDESVLIIREGNHFIDLWAATVLQLLDAGILPEHITLSGECTFCRADRYFSHRRDQGKTGAMGAFICWK